MGNRPPEAIRSFEELHDRIAWISGYESEAEVESAARQIAEYFGLPSFVFGAFFRTEGRENYRYLVGCVPQWCYLYNGNKWYAIDPFIEYALQNSAPILASEIPLASGGQERMMAMAAEYGFRSGVVVPAHSVSTVRIGILYLGTSAGNDEAQQSLARHRTLMRAFAVELLEWWDAKLRRTSLEDLELDDLDLELLVKARGQATAEEAARELGVTVSRVKSRYERLTRKLEASSKRGAVEKAAALGLIKPS